MIKLSWKLINSQKKWFYLLVFIGVLAIVTTTLFQIIAVTTENYTVEQAKKKYGDFTGLVVDVEKTREDLKDSALKIGEYGIEDAIKVKQTAIQIGFFDEMAFQMAHFQLIAGHFPKKSSEVIIEEAYLQKLEGNRWRVGERKKIGKQNLKLVGVIKNYSANWAINIDVSSKYYGFPNIIQLQTQQKTKGKHSFIVKENNSSELASKYGLNYMINDQFFYKGLQKYKVLGVVKVFFLIALFMLSIISIYQVVAVYYKKQDLLYTVLKEEGATKRKIEMIKALQILWVLSIASILALFIVYILYRIFVRYLFEYEVMIPWKDLLVGLVFSFVSMISVLISMIFLRFPQVKRIKKITMIYSLNLLVLIATLMLLFISVFIYKEEIVSPKKSNTLVVSANRVTQTTDVDGYDVALPPRKYISESEVEKIQMYEDVISLHLTALTDDLKIFQVPAIAQNLEEARALEEVSLVPLLLQDERVHTLQIKKQLVKNHAILIVPSKAIQQKHQSEIGEKLVIRRSDTQGNLKSWTYTIAAIKVVDSINPNIKIAINAQKAIQTHLFSGYNDVEVFLAPTISKEAYTTILNKISTLSAFYNDGIVGGNDNPLAKLFKSYYVITFIVSILFTCITIYFMLDRKLEEEGYVWGIYLSQGMTKYKVWLLLVKSMPLLWVESVLISSVILLVLYINQDYVSYPIIVYIKNFISVVCLILVLFLVAALLFYKKISKLSISQLLKRAVLRE